MKNIIFKSGLIALIPFFLSCDKAENIGIKYPLENGSEVKYIEIPIGQSMLFKDSIRTDNYSNMYVGTIKDAVTGDVTASGVCQPKYTKSTIPNDTLSFDSISLSLRYNATIPFNKPVNLKIDMYEMEDSLDSKVIYLGSYEMKKKRLIASFEEEFFIPNSNVNQIEDSVVTITIPKTNAFAQDFYNYAKANATTLASKTYNALSFETSNDGMVVFNLADSISGLRIHYTGQVGRENHFSNFSLDDGGNYTTIQRDRSSSEVSSIQPLVDFSFPNGKVYADPLAGVYPKLSLNELGDFLKNNEDVLINDAQIVIDIEDEAHRKNINNFEFFFKTNNLYHYPNSSLEYVNDLALKDANYFSLSDVSGVTTSLSEDNKQLSVSVSQFIQQLQKGNKQKNKLYFTNPFDTTSSFEVNDLILVSQNNLTPYRRVIKPNGIKLKIYYTQLKK